MTQIFEMNGIGLGAFGQRHNRKMNVFRITFHVEFAFTGRRPQDSVCSKK